MIVTFYSYKGGVGRTQLVANLAAYFCFHKGKKVLLIDWDLEAPGLHYYFNQPELQSFGIIDILEEYSEISGKMEGNVPVKDLPVFTKEKYCKNLTRSDSNGVIDIIPAGKYDKSFSRRVNSFNWYRFFDQLNGNNYIEFIKDKLRTFGYDYIFIDSRTGITDYTGITNVQMPQVNVIVTIPNHQNFVGSLKIINGIEKSPYMKNEFRKAIIFPLLSKIDMQLITKVSDWHSKFIDQFGSKFSELKQHLGVEHIDLLSFVRNTQLEYVKDVSFEETILFSDANLPTDNLSINYKNIAENLETIKNKIERPNFIREIIIEFLKSKHNASRSEIDEVVLSKLYDSRTEKQKRDHIKNQLQELSKEGIIKNISKSTKFPSWILIIKE